MTDALPRRPQERAAPALAAPSLLATTAAQASAETPDLSTPEGRIAAVCQWFDLAPPALAPGEKLLESEAALEWMIASGVSIDWLVMGDPKGLVVAFRREELQRREFLANVHQAECGGALA